MKKSHREKILTKLFAENTMVGDCPLPLLEKRKGVPLFFYRYPLFSKSEMGTPLSVSDDLLIKSSHVLNHKHLLLIEFMFLFIGCKNNKLCAEFPLSVMTKVFRDEGKKLLDDLSLWRITIIENMYDELIFGFIESSTFCAKEGKYYISFSSTVKNIYAIDYLLPLQKIKKILDIFDGVNILMIRYLFSLPMGATQGIGMDIVCKRLGLNLSGLEISKFTRLLLDNNKYLSQFGIEYDKEKRKVFYNLEHYPSLVNPSNDYSQAKEDKTKQNYIVLEDVLLDERLKRKAIDLEFKEEEIESLFECFIETSVMSEKKYKSLNIAWAAYLRSQARKKELSPISSIAYTQEMKDVAEGHGVRDMEALELFILFKNHYSESDLRRKSWVPMWESWVVRDRGYKRKEALQNKGLREYFDNEFYLAQRVSENIKSQLKEKGILVADIIAEKIHIESIGYKSWILPPSMGKGKETLFFWKSLEVQAQAMAEILPKRLDTLPSPQKYMENKNDR